MFPAIENLTGTGLNKLVTALLLAVTMLLLYIPTYAIVRNRRKQTGVHNEKDEPAPAEADQPKGFKGKLKGYDSCELNDIIGYDFIQTININAETKTAEPQKEIVTFKNDADRENSGLNEKVMGVTGRESNIPQDQPEETPEERKKREIDEAVLEAQKDIARKQIEMRKQDDTPVQEDTVPIDIVDEYTPEMRAVMDSEFKMDDTEKMEEEFYGKAEQTVNRPGYWANAPEPMDIEDYYVPSEMMEDNVIVNDDDDEQKVLSKLTEKPENPEARDSLVRDIMTEDILSAMADQTLPDEQESFMESLSGSEQE